MKYFDYAATTPISDSALNEYIYVAKNYYANPGSSPETKEYEEKLKEKILRSLKMDKSTLIFTSGGTESNNLAIKGIVKNSVCKKSHFITSRFEHASVYEVFQKLEEGNSISYLDITKEGKIDLEDLKKNLTPKTALVSLMSVNNEIGTIQPLKEAYEIVKNYNEEIIFMVDHVQGLSKIKSLGFNPDIMTISSHKIYGPKAVGAIILKEGLKLNQLILGGTKESGQRGGTQSLPAQAGFTQAVEDAILDSEEIFKSLKKLREEVENEVNKRGYLELNCQSETNVISVYINSEKTNEYFVEKLRANDYLLSTKSADSGINNSYSRTLEAIGLTKERADKTIRVSISHHQSKADIHRLFKEIDEIYKKSS